MRGLHSYIEFPPVYCDGELYVNGFTGTTFAVDSETGKIRWTHRVGGNLPSSPAIDGPRVLVASQDGTVTALSRESGDQLWQVRRRGRSSRRPSSSALAYFGSHDGRLFAVKADSGRVVWAYRRAAHQREPHDRRRVGVRHELPGAFICLNRRTRRALTIPQARSVPLREFHASFE
jgi:outer membrane protein assembly factor BamB